MANELTISGSLSLLKGNFKVELEKGGHQVNVTGSRHVKNVQLIGLTEEALVLGEIAAPGYILLVNRDPTNYVSVRRATGEGNMIKLRANGGFAVFELEATAPFLIANTAACYVEYLLIEQ